MRWVWRADLSVTAAIRNHVFGPDWSNGNRKQLWPLLEFLPCHASWYRPLLWLIETTRWPGNPLSHFMATPRVRTGRRFDPDQSSWFGEIPSTMVWIYRYISTYGQVLLWRQKFTCKLLAIVTQAILARSGWCSLLNWIFSGSGSRVFSASYSALCTGQGYITGITILPSRMAPKSS
jgi:hypothetical protein